MLDLGSGYGGAARYLAKNHGCKVTCLNLSETQNERNIYNNKNYGLNHLINVTKGNFEDIPFVSRGNETQESISFNLYMYRLELKPHF